MTGVARARKPKPPRCEATKAEDGRPCRRYAGQGTEHRGEGRCSLHEEEAPALPPFAENLEARAAFLEAQRSLPWTPARELIEPLGYHKRDVQALADADPEFARQLEEARQQDPESIRREVHRRAFAKESDRLLELIYKARVPEAAVLRQSHTRLEGQVEHRAVFADFSGLSAEGISPARVAELAACRSEFEIVRAVLGWVQPAQEELPRGGQAPLELVEAAAS